jgi:chromosome segregation protein
MKIKKLELYGFKSFVDRTVLHFDHDVLGIVGPNGCGKSNIVDAIRWCMGEQSARHLRGRSMEDVIFNGSESRTPHDFAEVTLTFENDAPAELPLEYKEYADIAVTRRLHRTGDSEYLINKSAVRLRDITDLFLGTGAGTKAYSIVEQGKVGLIVSAKAEDRRLLIEEAAGITKFKSRKKQAERKMELTQQNLLRVGDIVTEIERNLGALKRQAAKAERYVAYRSELEDLQLHEASHKYLELVGWIKLEGGEVERLSRTCEEMRAALGAREAEVDSVRLDAQAAEQVLDGAQSAFFAAESAVKAEEGAIARAKDRVTSLGHREQQAEGERCEMGEQAARLAAECESVTQGVAALEDDEKTQGARVASGEATLAGVSVEHGVAAAKVSERRQAIAKGQAHIASSEAKLAGFERRSAEMAARLDKLGVERDALDLARIENDGRRQQLAQSVEELREARAVAAAETARLEGLLGGLKQRIQGEERALDEAKGELTKRRSRYAALEEMRARLEGVGAGTKALVATRDATVVGLVADRLEAPAELTQALAGLLGARLQDVVVRDTDRGVQLLEELARSKKGRAAIMPLRTAYVAGARGSVSRGERCEGGGGERAAGQDDPIDGIIGPLADALRFAAEDEVLVRSLVGDALVVRDLPCARRLRQTGVRAALVTLDGAVLHPEGRIAGGQGDAVAAGMLESKREARELATEIERLDGVVAGRFEKLTQTRADLAQTGAGLDTARRETHAREIALVTAEKDLQKAEDRLLGVVSRLQSVGREREELARAMGEAGSERDEAARVLSEARASVELAQAELAQADAALVEIVGRLDAQRQAVTACKVGIAGTREKLAAARGTASRLTRSKIELEDRARRLDEELTANAKARGETVSELAAREAGLDVALDAARHAEDELAGARAEFDRLRAGLLTLESALKELRGAFDAAREDLQSRELALRERQLSLEHLLGGVADRFRGLHLPRVVGDFHMRSIPDEVSRSRIDELVRLIERMGSVNLDAMREHAENQERFEFYTTQKADLEKALGDLTRAIQQMNRESRRLFEETFELVNARFREIFPRMFRGGRAELRMTNVEDLLETGIDIVAQPPGKKLSSIELMSGGEKALTAVSLIFAIFQIKPSPFCILDEVDAPLDEANVSRYNDIVRSMTDRSQFILITHVKRTMQLVDVLYGVTMAEPGVSKVVSVKVNESAKEAAAPRDAAQAAVA